MTQRLLKHVRDHRCLDWAAANGILGVNELCEISGKAIKPGDIETLEWCGRRIGFKFNADDCVYAVKKGRLDVLKWLRLRHVPWDRGVLETAMEK